MSRIFFPPRAGRVRTGILAAFLGRWREHRHLRDFESVPYSVMKDIGYRDLERMNAK